MRKSRSGLVTAGGCVHAVTICIAIVFITDRGVCNVRVILPDSYVKYQVNTEESMLLVTILQIANMHAIRCSQRERKRQDRGTESAM
jgi:hypothetical protein